MLSLRILKEKKMQRSSYCFIRSFNFCRFVRELKCARHNTSFYSIVQVLTMIWLVALAFPQRDPSSEISNDSIIFDNNEPNSSSTTQRPTTDCPCIATSEYNPVCGTDNVTYWNMGRFNCARNCNSSTTLSLFYCFYYYCFYYYNIKFKLI